MSKRKQAKYNLALAIIERAGDKATPAGQSRLSEIQLHVAGFAEPGYDDPKSGIVASGNWNSISKWDEVQHTSVAIDDSPKRVGEALESMGVELEWSDEWEACAECGKLVRTQADSYGWKRSYWETDNGAICHECVIKSPAGYLGSLEGDVQSCVTLDLDLTTLGYTLIGDDYANGLYGGQCADPKAIGAALQKQGITRFVFRLYDVGQFDMHFSVYIHDSELPLLDKGAFDSAPKDAAEDPAILMQRGLQAASAIVRPAGAEGVQVIKVVGDQATASIVSPQDFIDGKALD